MYSYLSESSFFIFVNTMEYNSLLRGLAMYHKPILAIISCRVPGIIMIDGQVLGDSCEKRSIYITGEMILSFLPLDSGFLSFTKKINLSPPSVYVNDGRIRLFLYQDHVEMELHPRSVSPEQSELPFVYHRSGFLLDQQQVSITVYFDRLTCILAEDAMGNMLFSKEIHGKILFKRAERISVQGIPVWVLEYREESGINRILCLHLKTMKEISIPFGQSFRVENGKLNILCEDTFGINSILSVTVTSDGLRTAGRTIAETDKLSDIQRILALTQYAQSENSSDLLASSLRNQVKTGDLAEFFGNFHRVVQAKDKPLSLRLWYEESPHIYRVKKYVFRLSEGLIADISEE